MDSALAQQALQGAMPVDAHKTNDDNNYVSELFAQLTDPEFITSYSNDVNNFGQNPQFSSEAAATRHEKRSIKRSQQEVAEEIPPQNNMSGESSQSHHPMDGFNIGDATPFDFNALDFNALDFNMLDFDMLGQFDNIHPSFDIPEAASSIHAGVNIHSNDTNTFPGSHQVINVPVESTNIRIPKAPLPINAFPSYLGSVRGGLANNSHVGINTPGGRSTSQAPEDTNMMPLLVNPHQFSALQGISSADLLHGVGCQSRPQPPSTGPNVKRQRRRSPSPPAPQNALQFVHDELSMPSDFRANPNNHARFKYHRDGTREYLNAPKKRRKRRCSDRGPQSSG
ncbi:hypothetical protein UA08_04636 [Talaromyces atroroseus]|uniref:Uncharacterized protein n=1 Tax=Talaromyces atroroseus TaxID=1441469 RepID=A0A225ANN4_TALAT|nr:hypothetical protein UA08_04636 [Talaromyces atroroseus]OKL59984.1 hypothetical protein UA08_04636 [Talaromyces atroroseus]